MIPQHFLYTIGHGTRPIDELLGLLKKFGIAYLADLRSKPWSKFNPQYNYPALKEALNREGIKYVYMGDTLGGRPSDPSCYNHLGRIDYEIVRQKDFFRQGITRLVTAYEKNIRLVLLCSESRPEQCHRSRLVGRVLTEENLFLQHIDEKGALRDQADLHRTPDGKLF